MDYDEDYSIGAQQTILEVESDKNGGLKIRVNFLGAGDLGSAEQHAQLIITSVSGAIVSGGFLCSIRFAQGLGDSYKVHIGLVADPHIPSRDQVLWIVSSLARQSQLLNQEVVIEVDPDTMQVAELQAYLPAGCTVNYSTPRSFQSASSPSLIDNGEASAAISPTRVNAQAGTAYLNLSHPNAQALYHENPGVQAIFCPTSSNAILYDPDIEELSTFGNAGKGRGNNIACLREEILAIRPHINKDKLENHFSTVPSRMPLNPKKRLFVLNPEELSNLNILKGLRGEKPVGNRTREARVANMVAGRSTIGKPDARRNTRLRGKAAREAA